jgi:polyisoprenoid-binding protein YceI
MNKSILYIGLCIALAFYACGGGTTNTSAALDACGCAKESVKGSPSAESIAKCQELRSADSKFEADFQKCLVAERAGLDTSKVSVQPMDAANGLNLPAANDGMYTFAADESTIRWVGAKVTGKHNGSIKLKSGKIEFAGGAIKSGEFLIDMPSLVVEDLSGDAKAELEGHLKSDDFFATSKFADAKFVFKSANAKNKHQFDVTGDLIIKGISKPVTATLLLVPTADNTIKVNGGFAIDRTLYDIKFRSAKFFSDLGDKMIEDNFLITLDLKGKK